ncbi:lipopolysaccharide core heptose(I) kinase RfaP [Dasania marina]|uniref:lipopolysaccharide core heptose(I) kinase RfaP n=1 Tax=Dasania marina TaxID=471499 RepID=UPI0003664F97|nr:lipopolysaccharide core heptose(I) kinase RfaP [Dasania marina]
MELYIRGDIEQAWGDSDPFQEVEKLRGEVYRNKEGRTTLQTQINGKSFFVKVHRGIGWKEIFKNLVQFRLPIVGASNEFAAAEKLASLGVDTLTTAAFGKKGCNPATQLSFIVTDDLSNTISLEDYCANWKNKPPGFVHKKLLIELLAHVSHVMHGAGINHRDYYICHFLLEKESLVDLSAPKCYLIDLHRAQLRNKTPQRWAVKDIAGLYFSAMDAGLTKRDCLRFMRIYQAGLSPSVKQKEFWLAVNQKAMALYQKDHGRPSPCEKWWQ